ncbi:MAG: hypothetical protein RIR18_885 [Pseudomonadota bacterium]|jgi:hypothetical protein
MKYVLIFIALICGNAFAEGPRIGVEFESEKDNKSGLTNQALTVIPGWEFSEESLINRVELLLERNQDTSADSRGVTAKENKLFLRFRHDGDISESFGYYIRGGFGRAYNDTRSFNYAYVEPGVEYKITHQWAWTVAYREINSIDGLTGEHVGKFITGPSFDLDAHNEFELRYVKGEGDRSVKALVFEYVHKY